MSITNTTLPKDLPISYYLLNKCKLWVWDFDDTIIDTTTYLKKSMKPNDIRKRTQAELDIEVPQWRYFKRLVDYLTTHGKYVAIASFGTYEIIQAYMDRIMGFNQRYFSKKNIIAPCVAERESLTFSTPPNKNEYIYLLMQVYRVQDFKRVVLFDDLCSNVADAISIGIIAVQISAPRNGDIGSEMYFGPWVMTKFDKTIEADAGKELYLNRTFTGVSNRDTDKDKIPYKGKAFDKIDFGTGVQNTFAPIAFGSSIGSRKTTTRPDVRWNKRNSGGKIAPTWANGIWTSSIQQGYDSGEKDRHGKWDSDGDDECVGMGGTTLEKGMRDGTSDSNPIFNSTLGGTTGSFWDKYHNVNNAGNTDNTDNTDNDRDNDRDDGRHDNDDEYIYQNIKSKHGKDKDRKYNENKVMGIIEGFESNESNEGFDSSCNSCKKISFDWITCTLFVIIAIMVIMLLYNLK